MLKVYRNMTAGQLWDNLNYFVQTIMPVAKACGVKMTIHPDDPPWPVLGIPRIIGNGASPQRLMALYDHSCNGICFCSGSLGSNAYNDLPHILRHFGEMERIHFIHLRNVFRTGPRSFYESGHLSAEGSIDMYELLKVMHEVGFSGPV